MKKKLPSNKLGKVAILILLVVIVAFALLQILHKAGIGNEKPKNLGTSKSACSLFDPIAAYYLFGGNVYKTQNVGTSKLSTGDIKVTNCVYKADQAMVKENKDTAVITVHKPYTKSGLRKINDRFNDLPKDAQQVKGYGKSAYWDESKGELNILKTNTWYGLQYGPSQGSKRSLDQTKKLAEAIKSRL